MTNKPERTCPECGSTDIDKEYMKGMDTGDLKCLRCGFAALPYDKDWYKEKSEADPDESA